MKTSNKILVILFVSFFGFLIAVQLILRSKYLNHDSIPGAKFDAYYYDEYKPAAARHVRIEGIAQCQVYAASSTRLLIQKNSLHYAAYHVSGDTLIIKGYDPAEHEPNYKQYLAPQDIKLYLPPAIDIYAISSNINLQGNAVKANAASWHLKLNNTDVNTRFYNYRDSVNRYFDTLYVDAGNRSGIYLFHNEYLNGVNVILNNSVINDLKAKIDDIHVSADSISTVVVNGNNIVKLNSAVIRK